MALGAAACGGNGDAGADGTSPEEASATGAADFEPVTIENCGVTTTYDAPPERAVPLDQNVTEIMLALGLEDRIAAYARQHYDPTEPVLPEFAEEYDQLDLIGDASPSREVFLETEPDFALAAFGFSDDSGLSQEGLTEDSIETYLLGDQCDGRSEPVSFDDLFTAVSDVGAIFGVEDRADALVEEMQATLDEVSAEVEGKDPVSVFIYDSGEDAPFTVGGTGMSNAIVEAAGGENIYGDLDDQFADGSWEVVLDRDPDVIVIMNYFHGEDSGETVESKRAVLEDRLAATTAVQEGRVVDMQLTGFFLSVRNADSVEALADYLHR
jgi:iron complex transport system substrate-binding protein